MVPPLTFRASPDLRLRICYFWLWLTEIVPMLSAQINTSERWLTSQTQRGAVGPQGWAAALAWANSVEITWGLWQEMSWGRVELPEGVASFSPFMQPESSSFPGACSPFAWLQHEHSEALPRKAGVSLGKLLQPGTAGSPGAFRPCREWCWGPWGSIYVMGSRQGGGGAAGVPLSSWVPSGKEKLLLGAPLPVTSGSCCCSSK